MRKVIPTIPDIPEAAVPTRTTAEARTPDAAEVWVAAFAALPTPVAVVDAAGRVVTHNPAFAEMLGAHAQPGSGFEKLFGLTDQATVRQVLLQAGCGMAACVVRLANSRRVELTVSRMERSDRRNLVIVQLSSARAAGVAGVPRVSERDELAEAHHDLRTPLNAIIGFAEMIQGDLLGQGVSARYRSYAQDIVGAAALLLRNVERLLRAASNDVDAPDARNPAGGPLVGFAHPSDLARPPARPH